LFLLLSFFAKMVFFGWAALGLVVYATYGRKRSTLAPGYVEAPEESAAK
jgi:APA family basic amino acid/polyamine antiporter